MCSVLIFFKAIYLVMHLRWNLLLVFLNLLIVVQLIEGTPRPPLRPPPWRNPPPNQHHGRGGMPIPIHGDNFAQRRIYNGPPPPGYGPNKFPPMRNKLPPPGYFHKQRRPPPPPPSYGGGGDGFNQYMRPPPLVNGPPGYNPMKQTPQNHGMMQTFPQNAHDQHSLPAPLPTLAAAPPTLPPTASTYQYQQGHHQQQQIQVPHQSQNIPQQQQQPQPTPSQFQNQRTGQQEQQQALNVLQQQHVTQQYHQQITQNQQMQQHGSQQQQTTLNQFQQQTQQPANLNQFQQQTQQPANLNQFQQQTQQTANVNQAQWSHPLPSQNMTATAQVVGTIQPSQQTAQSNQYMTVVKPESSKPSPSPQPHQIYQFHLPPANSQQPNSIIQIHLSSTTETPKEGGSAGKDYFTGSTFRPQKYDSIQTYPNNEYLPYEKPKSTPAPSLNFKDMNSEKTVRYERPIIYKNSKEQEERTSHKSHYSKPGGGGQGQLIDFTTESSAAGFGNYKSPSQSNKADYEQDHQVSQSQSRQDYAPSKADYEHALTPPSKHDYGLLPPSKQSYGLSLLAKHDYEHYKNYKDYASKYSQLDPLYHPDGDVKSSLEDDPDPELTLPERYDNSFSANYKHDEQGYEGSRHKQLKKRPQAGLKNQPQPEEILSALGLSTNPLDHVDIVKTANDKYKKEPLYSLPDRQIEDDDDEDSDSREMGYPGTGYNMAENAGTGSASRIKGIKRPPPPEMIHPQVKGISPPALPSHPPDHRDDIITADNSNEFWQHPPRIAHREDGPPHYGRYPDPHLSHGPRYPGPAQYPYGQQNGYESGPSSAPPHYHGPTSQPYGHPIYVTEPDPIIEIIVQDSNVTLPPLPKPKTTTPAPVTPEPVHVFYVRYSNNNNKTIIGSPSENHNLHLEPPVPSLAVKGPDGHFRPPPTYQQQFTNQYQQQSLPQAQGSQSQPNYAIPNGGSHYNGQQQRNQQIPGSHFTNQLNNNVQNAQFSNTNQQQHASENNFHQAQDSPLTSTTMRAIIRLDKNEYDSPHLKVAFDHNSNPFSHLHQPQQVAEASQQHIQVVQQPQPENMQTQPFQSQSQTQISNQQLLHQLQQQFQQLQQNSMQQQNQNQNTHPQQNSHPHQQQFQTPTQPQSPQFSSQLTQQFQSQSQFQHPEPNQHQFSNTHTPQASNQIPQFQNPPSPPNFEFQYPSQPQDIQSQSTQQVSQSVQQPQGHQEQVHVGNHDSHTALSQQVAQFQIPAQNTQGDAQQYEQAPSPSELDFNMDPIWTNWNQPRQQNVPQEQQNQNQPQNQQDQNPAPSTNNQQSVIAPVPQQMSSGGYNPMLNYGGGEPLGLSGLHAIGTENNMRFDNPIGLRPPPGPVYPKLGFQKRIGLDDLATLLGEESVQQQQQLQTTQQQQQQQQQSQPQEPEISATYHDPDQEHAQQQLLKATQQLQHQQQQNNQHHQQQQNNQHHQQQQNNQHHQHYSDQEKMSKLPDDVPEELKKQLLDSGILGNADVQVINYDQNLFKDLTNLPSEAIESFQQSDDISKLLASATRPVRSILVVNEARRSLRPKRKESPNKLLLFIQDDKTLIYNVKKHSVSTVENKLIQNAIDYTHHKN